MFIISKKNTYVKMLKNIAILQQEKKKIFYTMTKKFVMQGS